MMHGTTNIKKKKLPYKLTNLLVTGLPTGLYSKNLNYKDTTTTF